ncbi:MAG: ribosome maturation factor RimM [Eubacterium sp.]|nr:ribosome maturation factor RimM [Eubacterium sp.]
MQKLLQVGSVTTTHGVRGEMKVFPTTDDPVRFRKLKEVIMQKGSVTETRKVQSAKFFKGMVILKVEGIETMDEAAAHRGFDLFVPREQGVRLKKDEYYTADLIGMDVYLEDGSRFGTLSDILQTGANDVYSVTTEANGEVLIPAIKACIINVDVAENKMIVHLLPGLLDL